MNLKEEAGIFGGGGSGRNVSASRIAGVRLIAATVGTHQQHHTYRNATMNSQDAAPTATEGSGRFQSQGSTAEDVLKSQTVGLVGLSDFRKRRAEALEQRDSLSANLCRFAPAANQPAGQSSGTVTPISNDEG